MNRNFRISISLIFVFAAFCFALPQTANAQRLKKSRATKKTAKTAAPESLIVIRPGRLTREGTDGKLGVPPNKLRIAIDYDHDGRADFVVFNPATNNWQIIKSSGGTIVTPFGLKSTDYLTPGDFDG